MSLNPKVSAVYFGSSVNSAWTLEISSHAIQAINSGLGELPMLAAEEKYEAAQKLKENDEGSQQSQMQQPKAKVSTKILADGTQWN